MLSKKLQVDIPWRLWRSIIVANDGNLELAHANLAIAVLVAAENVSVAHRPKRPPPLPEPLVCMTCGHRHDREPIAAPLYADDGLLYRHGESPNPPGYDVEEGPAAEMPVPDPWARSWD
jgi:hypothetical protein